MYALAEQHDSGALHVNSKWVRYADGHESAPPEGAEGTVAPTRESLVGTWAGAMGLTFTAAELEAMEQTVRSKMEQDMENMHVTFTFTDEHVETLVQVGGRQENQTAGQYTVDFSKALPTLRVSKPWANETKYFLVKLEGEELRLGGKRSEDGFPPSSWEEVGATFTLARRNHAFYFNNETGALSARLPAEGVSAEGDLAELIAAFAGGMGRAQACAHLARRAAGFDAGDLRAGSTWTKYTRGDRSDHPHRPHLC